MLEHEQALAPRGQAVSPQQPLHGAGRHPHLPQPLRVGGHPGATPRRFGDRDGQQPALDRWRQAWRGPRAGFEPPRVQPIHTVATQPMLPPIEQRARDPRLPARRADANRRRAPHDLQAHPLYAFVEGHQSILPKWFPWPDFHSGNDRAGGPHLLPTEVLTLTRLRTH